MRVKTEGQKRGSKMREKNQGHNSYIYQMCKRAPLPIYMTMRNENVIDKQALEWCSLGM